jgi:hypothetical protein
MGPGAIGGLGDLDLAAARGTFGSVHPIARSLTDVGGSCQGHVQ